MNIPNNLYYNVILNIQHNIILLYVVIFNI